MPESPNIPVQPYNREADFLPEQGFNINPNAYKNPYAKPAPGTPGGPAAPTSKDVLDSIFGNLSKTAKQSSPFLDSLDYTNPIQTRLDETARYNSPTYGFTPFDPNIETEYGDRQGVMEKWRNNIVKFLANTTGSFIQGIATLPLVLNSGEDASKLYDNNTTNGIQDWLESLETSYPNYETSFGKAHPVLDWIPFIGHSGDTWGGLLKNLGFTVGAIASAALQDSVVGALTGGAGDVPLLPAQLRKIATSFGKLGKIYTNPAATTTLMKAIENGEDVASVINHLSNTVKVNNEIRYGLALTTAAMSEAAFEANTAFRNIKKNLSDDFYQKHGRDPNAEESKEINEYAQSGGNASMLTNTALLMLTDSITMGSLFKPFKSAERQVAQEIAGGVKIGLKPGSLDAYEKIAPPTGFKLLPTLGKVGRASRTVQVESFEEGSQFVIQRTAEDYYQRKYDKKSIEDVDNFNKSLSVGLKDVFTTREGLENIFLGGLSGGVIHLGNRLIEGKRGIQNHHDALVDQTLQSMNSVGVSNLFTNKEEAITALGINRDLEKAVKEQDIFQYHNMKFQQLFNFVYSGNKAGRMEMRLQQLEMLKDLPKEQFEKMFSMEMNDTNKANMSAYVDGLIDQAHKMSANIEKVNNVFKNPYRNINQMRKKDEVSLKEHFDSMAFEEYKRQMALDLSEIDDHRRRGAAIKSEISSVAPTINVDDIIKLTHTQGLSEIKESLNSRIKQLEQSQSLLKSEPDHQAYKDAVKEEAFLRGQLQILDKTGDGYYNNVYNLHRLLNYWANGNSLNGNIDVNPIDILPMLKSGVDAYKLINTSNRALFHYNRLATKEGMDEYITRVLAEYPNERGPEGAAPVAGDVVNDPDAVHIDENGNEKVAAVNTPEGQKANAKDVKAVEKVQENIDKKAAEVEALAKTAQAVVTADNVAEVAKAKEDLAKAEAELEKLRSELAEEKSKHGQASAPLSVSPEAAQTEVEFNPDEQDKEIAAKKAGTKSRLGRLASSIFKNFDPFVMISRVFSRDYERKRGVNEKQNLHDALFSLSPADVYNKMTLKISESTEGQKHGDFRKNKETETYYQGYAHDIDIVVDGKVVGKMQPANRLAFKRGEQYLPLWEMTKDEYAEVTKNPIETYDLFQEHLANYRAIYEKVMKKFAEGKNVFSNKDVKSLFDIVSWYGFAEYSRAGTKIADLKYRTKGDAVIDLPMVYSPVTKQMERAMKPTILNEKELSDEDRQKLWNFISDNIEQLRGINSRYVYVFQLPNGEYEKISPVAARGTEISSATLNETLKKIQDLDTTSKEAIRSLNADLRNNIYIADSNNRKGSKTNMFLSIGANGDLLINFVNKPASIFRAYKVNQAKAAVDFEGFVDKINSVIQAKRHSDKSLDKLNVVLDAKDFKTALRDSEATLDSLADKISVAAYPEVFADPGMAILPKTAEGTKPIEPKKSNLRVKPKYTLNENEKELIKALSLNLNRINGMFRTGIEQALKDDAQHPTLIRTILDQFLDDPNGARNAFGNNITEKILKIVGGRLVTDRRSLQFALEQIFKLPQEQALQVSNIYDRVAKVWAARHGRDKADFYSNLILMNGKQNRMSPSVLNQADPDVIKQIRKEVIEKIMEERPDLSKAQVKKMVDGISDKRAAHLYTQFTGYHMLKRAGFTDKQIQRLDKKNQKEFDKNQEEEDVRSIPDVTKGINDDSKIYFLERMFPDLFGENAEDNTNAISDLINEYLYSPVGDETVKSDEKFPNANFSSDIARHTNREQRSNPNLLNQQVESIIRAAVQIATDGKATIYAVTDPNVSSPLHELAHIFEHSLTDSEVQTILGWTGHEKWTRETSEMFARGFERYLADGTAQSTALKSIFKYFKDWLKEIYKGIVGSPIDVQLNDPMRKIYAEMLGDNFQQEVKQEVRKEKAAEPRPKKIVTPQPAPATNGASIALTITKAIRQQLYDLGYNRKDVDAMKPQDAQDIISGNKTKPQVNNAVIEDEQDAQYQPIEEEKTPFKITTKDISTNTKSTGLIDVLYKGVAIATLHPVQLDGNTVYTNGNGMIYGYGFSEAVKEVVDQHNEDVNNNPDRYENGVPIANMFNDQSQQQQSQVAAQATQEESAPSNQEVGEPGQEENKLQAAVQSQQEEELTDRERTALLLQLDDLDTKISQWINKREKAEDAKDKEGMQNADTHLAGLQSLYNDVEEKLFGTRSVSFEEAMFEHLQEDQVEVQAPPITEQYEQGDKVMYQGKPFSVMAAFVTGDGHLKYDIGFENAKGEFNNVIEEVDPSELSRRLDEVQEAEQKGYVPADIENFGINDEGHADAKFKKGQRVYFNGKEYVVESVRRGNEKEGTRAQLLTLKDGKGKVREGEVNAFSVLRKVSADESKVFTYAGLQYVLSRLSKRFGIEYELVDDPEGDWKGRFYQGRVLINTAKVDKTTPIHEYLHPMISVLQQDNPELYEALTNELINLIKEGDELATSIARDIAKDPNYKGLSATEKTNEALVRYIAHNAAENLNAEGHTITSKLSGIMKRLIDKFSKWLEKIWYQMRGYYDEGGTSLRRIPLKELPVNMTLQDLADTVSATNLAFDFTDKVDLIDKLDLFQKETDSQEELSEDGRIIKNLKRRAQVLQDTAKRRVPSEELMDEYKSIRNILNSEDEALSLIKFVDRGIKGLSWAADEFNRITATLKDENIKMTPARVRDLTKSLETVKSLLGFYLTDVRMLLDKQIYQDQVSEKDEEHYTKVLRKADKVADQIRNRSVDLMAEWLYPHFETSIKNIKDKYPEYNLTKEQFKNKIYAADRDIDRLFYFFGSVGTSHDPISAIVRDAIVHVYEESHLYDAQLRNKILNTYDDFLKRKGLKNERKDIEEHFKRNWLRKAQSLEIVKFQENKETGRKEPVYDYVERWAFQEEFYYDLWRKEYTQYMESLGEAPSIDDEEAYQKWVNKLEAWQKENGTENHPAERFRNPKFQELYADPLYKTLYDAYKEGNDKLLDGDRLQYGIVPQVSKGSNMFSDLGWSKNGLKNLAKKAVEFIAPTMNHDWTDTLQNLDGSTYKKIKMAYIRSLEEQDLDLALPETVFKYATAAHLNNALHEVEPNVHTLRSLLTADSKYVSKARQINQVANGKTVFDNVLSLPAGKEERKTLLNKQLTAFIDDVVYGDTSTPDSVKVLGKEIDLNKLGANMSFLTALNNMAFNVTAGVNNVVIGNINTIGEAIGGRFYKGKNWRKGAGQYGAALWRGDFIKDTITLKKSLITQLGIKYDAIQGEFRDKYGKRFVGNVAQKYATLDTIFVLTHAGEHQIQIQGMLALMDATRVKNTKGEEMSLYDAHYVDSKGQLQLKKDILWDAQDEKDFTKKLHGLNQMLNGNYSKFDKAYIQRKWYGKMMLVYRKYIYNSFRARYGKVRPDYMLGEVMEGYYRTFFTKMVRDIKTMVTDMKISHFKEGWDANQKYAAAKTTYEMALLAGMTIIGIAISAGADKDTDKKSWGENYLALMMLRVRNDLGLYSMFGVQDMFKMTRNPSAVIMSLSRYADFFQQLLIDPFKEYKRKTGLFDKGDSVLKAKMLKAIPIVRQFINLLSPAEQAKFYTLTNKAFNNN